MKRARSLEPLLMIRSQRAQWCSEKGGRGLCSAAVVIGAGLVSDSDAIIRSEKLSAMISSDSEVHAGNRDALPFYAMIASSTCCRSYGAATRPQTDETYLRVVNSRDYRVISIRDAAWQSYTRDGERP